MIVKKDIQFQKVQNGLLKVEELDFSDYSQIRLSILTIKNDLNLSYLALIEVPFYSNSLNSVLKKRESGAFDLFDILYYDLASGNSNDDFINYVLKNVPDYILETIKVYLECDASIDRSSKLLFTHRNTVNYRVNKFISSTNINIKNCANLALCRLMLSTYQSKQGREL